MIDAENGIFVVADGMGGHRGGEVASKMAVETIVEVVKRAMKSTGLRKLNPRQILASAYEQASHRIFDKSQTPSSVDLQGMGTTLVTAFKFGDSLFIGNVGDSRAYLFSHDRLWQLTEDHSLVNEQVRAGLISEADIGAVGQRNVITRSVGFERDVQVDVLERSVAPGDLYLVCSDGLYGMVPDKQIEEFCRTSKPSELVSICIEAAKKGGGDDNITVLVLYAESRSN